MYANKKKEANSKSNTYDFGVFLWITKFAIKTNGIKSKNLI